MKCQRPRQLLGRRQRRLKRARGPWPPPLSPSLLPQEAARRRLLRAGGSPGERSLGEAPAPAEGTGPRIQNCRCSYPTTATLYVPSTTLPIHTPSLPPPPPPPLPRPNAATPSHIQLSGGAGTWTQVLDWEPYRSPRVSPTSSSPLPRLCGA